MEIKNEKLIFSTGRIEYANLGIIGISPDCSEVLGGYDGVIYRKHEEWELDDYEEMTISEKIELADYMISQWQKFKDNA